jgi:hypothetical protein
MLQSLEGVLHDLGGPQAGPPGVRTNPTAATAPLHSWQAALVLAGLVGDGAALDAKRQAHLLQLAGERMAPTIVRAIAGSIKAFT